MSLRGVKWLLSDRKSTYGTYYPIFTPCTLGAFQRVAMNVGNHGVGVHNVTPDVGDSSVGVRNIAANGRNGCVQL